MTIYVTKTVQKHKKPFYKFTSLQIFVRTNLREFREFCPNSQN